MAERMQVIFSKGVASVDPTASGTTRYGQATTRKVSLAWALIEAEPGRYKGEAAYDMDFTGQGDKLRIRLSQAPVAMDDDFETTLPPDGDVTEAFTQIKIKAEGFKGLVTFGRMVLRRTEFPVQPGREAFVACGLVVNSNNLPGAVMFEFAGDGPMTQVGRRDADEAIKTGMASAHPFQTPVWGFGEEKRCFVSTMRQDVLDVCARYNVLENAADRTREQARELEALSQHPYVRSVYHVSRDEDFEAWKGFLRASGRWDEVSPRMKSFPTEAERDASKAAMNEVFSEWRAGRKAAGFRF